MRPFVPLFRNAHLATLAGNFWPRPLDERRFPSRLRISATEAGVGIAVEENRPPGEARGEVLLLHGLEGSSRSGYLISLAQRLLEAGFAVHRMNLRGCGLSEPHSPTLYHSGLTHDARFILEQWRAEGRGPRFLAGFSLGGNVVLKLAGELGEAAAGLVEGVAAVSTPIDLHACVRAIGKPSNWIYHQKFVRSLRRRYARRHRMDPARFPAVDPAAIRTIFDFDNRITAPFFGFGDAPNYYATQSALRFVEGIRVPALLVQAKDDPMIPFALFSAPELRANPCIRLLAVEHGGHLGFLARGAQRFWLDAVLCGWFEALRNKSSPVIVSN
ncbi:MAG: alpha/beta fold hydrolase [Bryobacteraceae bacterium]|nr:alpha/beta fold hydrolase [Bryobacteraceae bacterium]